MKLTKDGEMNGAGTYRSEGGRFWVTSSVSVTRDKADRPTRTRWYEAFDTHAPKDSLGYRPTAARATTLAVLKERLDRYLRARP